jgi:hypothetical protein
MLPPTAASAADSIANETARFLAGMPVAPEAPLSPLARQSSWRQHAGYFDAAWKRLDDRQLTQIRAWSGTNLTAPQSTLFYMFSGPDFLYADAFFPNATTYVMSGLEPIGPIPDLSKLPAGAVGGELRRLQASLNSVLSYSFFITKNMSSQLNTGYLKGTLPVIYVFLARSGKTINSVSLVSIDQEGALVPADQPEPKGATKGVKITFSGSDGRERTLYYFTTDLSDGGVKNSGFLKFCEKLGTGDSFVKSASYLLHSGGFSKVRSFILDHSSTVLQDDSGIPVTYFKPEDWQLKAYGAYPGPISIFANRYQNDLKKLYRTGKAPSLPFGVGYRWRPQESNLLVAARGSAKPVQSQ